MSGTYRTLPSGQKAGVDNTPATTAGVEYPIRYVTRQLTSAEILALNTTPITIAAAKTGVSYAVRSFVASLHATATAYITNTDLLLSVNGVTLSLATGALSGTAVKATQGDIKSAISATATALVVEEGGGNPATGTGTVTVYAEYLEIPT